MRILIIEAISDHQDFLKQNFEEQCFAVDIAKDGEMGLAVAKIFSYDLIILNNSLPQTTGREICKQLREEGSKVPILTFSENSDLVTRVELLNAGADDYINKPFEFEEILARARALLRRPQTILGEVISFGDITLDAFKHKVIRAKKYVMLTRKELMLLEYFMRNAGTVLSRNMILEHVWDMNADPFSNTIESHIVTLRRKIDLQGMPKSIHTIPGRGYKFDLES